MIHIPKAEYTRRRKALMAQMEPNSIAILPAAAVAIRNRDVEHVYRQDSDFQYLSGFPEPEAVIVLMPGRQHGEYVLFCRERNAERELWDGLRAGTEGAIRDFGADDAFPITDIDDILPGLIEGRDRVYSAMGSNAEFDRHLMEWINVIRSKAHLGAQPPNEFVALDHLLHDMRLYKSAAEVKVMREAARISCAAHVKAMQASRAGLHEFSLEAELDYEFRKGGAKMPAYGSIVAAGRNSCILHYQQNDALLKDGDLVLIDAGCEIDCYASDITRTWPVNGRFSAEQKAIYEIVLASQEAAFAEIAPNKHWNQAHEATVQVITAGLVKLGLLQGDVDELIAGEAYKPFYMHRAGHWLGMDVHDVGEYKVGGEWRVLEVGMALTVEPGIYISPDNQNVAKKWRGIGVRIDNLMLSPSAGIDPQMLFDTRPLAGQILATLENHPRFHALSAKFAVQLDGGEALAMLEHHHDLWLSAFVRNGQTLLAFGLAGCPGLDAPLAAVRLDQGHALVVAVLDAFLELATPEQTRMRHLPVDNMLGRLSLPLLPIEGFKRPPSGALLHLGTYPQEQKNQFYVAAVAPLGRLDSMMLKGAAQLASDYGDGTLRFTPWQGVLLPNVEKPHGVTERLAQLGFLCSIDQPLARMTACTGSSGCAKALADTKADAVQLAALHTGFDVHLSGCPRSCAAAHTAPVTLLAVSPGHYDLYFREAAQPGFGRLHARNLSIEAAGALLRARPRSNTND